MPTDDTVRLQKFLAERGVCSRRGAAELLASGRIAVNGETVREPGLRVQPGVDQISLDGKPLEHQKPAHTTIILHKPRGYICSRAEAQGRTVYSLLPEHLHSLRCAGRLDKDSEGLLVMSDDGELILRLTHPRHGHRKIYRVTVSGRVDAGTLRRLRSELEIDGYRIRPVTVETLGAGQGEGRTILRFVLEEGRNRQIRKMCELAGLHIHRLVREQSGPYTLAGLKPGEWRREGGE